MYLYHCYDHDLGPFKNISELPDEEAEKIMQRLKAGSVIYGRGGMSFFIILV